MEVVYAMCLKYGGAVAEAGKSRHIRLQITRRQRLACERGVAALQIRHKACGAVRFKPEQVGGFRLISFFVRFNESEKKRLQGSESLAGEIAQDLLDGFIGWDVQRSEERRVGRECRARRWAAQRRKRGGG